MQETMFKFNNLSILLAFAVAVGSCAGLRNPLGGYFPTADVANDIIGDDVGEALHVTPLLKSGANGAAVARAAAETHIGNVTSYTGYFTVDEKHDGNMFFWYFPSQDNNPDAPTVRGHDLSHFSFVSLNPSPLLLFLPFLLSLLLFLLSRTPSFLCCLQVVWLQGGPGGSDMFGLFVEIGPFRCVLPPHSSLPRPFTTDQCTFQIPLYLMRIRFTALPLMA